MAAAPNPGGAAPLARRWLLNLVLLAVVAGLALLLWYRAGEAPAPEAAPLTPLVREAIRSIDIERPGEPAVRLARTDSGWRLSAPIEARVDAFTLDSLLDLAAAPTDRPVAPGDGDLARFGLAEPGITVRLNETEVHFGAAHPLEDRRYVQYDSRVYLLPVRFYRAAAAPYANFIDTRLVEPGRKLTALRLLDFSLTLEGGTWRREPALEALSSDRINAFVDDWKHARALRVEKYAGEPVRSRIVLTLAGADGAGDETEVTVGILAREPELVLYRPDEGLQYHFPQSLEERLLSLAPEKESVKSDE